MDRKKYLDKIISEFENWWINDPHSSNMDFYNDTVSYSYLNSLANTDFVDFFYDFVSEGGRVQSGGDRTKNKFRDTVLNPTAVGINLAFYLEYKIMDFNEINSPIKGYTVVKW